MPVAAVVGAIGGALISSKASKSAAQTQASAATDAANASLTATRETNDLTKQINDQNRADNAPWRAAGTNALAGLGSYGTDVSNWYKNALGRNPSADEVSYWNQQLSSGQSPDSVYRSFLSGAQTNGEQVNPNAGNTSKSASGTPANVANWYGNILGRVAAPSEIAFWEKELKNGRSPDDVFRSFISSAQGHGEPIISKDGNNWQDASMPAKDFQTISGFGKTDFGDKKSDYANTNIGSKLSEYRNPDFGDTGFQNTNLKDAASAYRDPNLKNMLSNFSMADFQADPGLQYRIDQGNRGVENSASAKNMQLSGATLKALARFNQDEASSEYGNAFNRYRTQKLDQYGQSVDDFGRSEAQRQEQYGQRNDEYKLGEQQRAAKYGIATDQYNRADAQRVDQYGQRVGQFGRDENQRQEQYQQRQDEYNRNENQRINKYAISQDQYNRGVAADALGYNRLAQMAGIGQQANSENAAGNRAYASQVSANTNSAVNNAGRYGVAAGDARASGTLGAASSINNALNTGYGLYQQYKTPTGGSVSSYNDPIFNDGGF